MNEYLTILTTGGLLALFAMFTAYFLLSPNDGQHKQSLYRMVAALYIILFFWNLLYVVTVFWYTHLSMNWQLTTAFNLPLFPFITFIIKEMLYPDKQVGWKTIFQHAGLPFALLAIYLVTFFVSPAASVWMLGLLFVWAAVYLGIMLPLAFMHIRRYNALVQEVFVDADGHSLAWLARLSLVLFTTYVLYGIFALFELSYLTSWLFNVFEFVVYMVLGLQISRMRSNNVIHIDQPEADVVDLPTQAESAGDVATAVSDPEAEKFIANLEQWLMTDNRIQSNNLNREMVARALGTNHVVLARTLREHTGMTLTQFVTDVRLREAERLLLNSNLTIEEIFYHVGYQTRSTFSRAFQDRNNCSATEWREKHRQK